MDKEQTIECLEAIIKRLKKEKVKLDSSCYEINVPPVSRRWTDVVEHHSGPTWNVYLDIQFTDTKLERKLQSKGYCKSIPEPGSELDLAVKEVNKLRSIIEGKRECQARKTTG